MIRIVIRIRVKARARVRVSVRVSARKISSPSLITGVDQDFSHH